MSSRRNKRVEEQLKKVAVFSDHLLLFLQANSSKRKVRQKLLISKDRCTVTIEKVAKKRIENRSVSKAQAHRHKRRARKEREEESVRSTKQYSSVRVKRKMAKN